jgi:HEAT repeat protein
MNLTGVRRLAGRVHRGDVDDRGEPFLARLDRVAGLVRACGGDRTVQAAVYLLGVRSTGVTSCDLLRMGVPLAVCRLVEAATVEPFKPFEQRWIRLRRNRSAALLYAAVLADDCRPPRPVSRDGMSWPEQVQLYAYVRELAGEQRLPPVPVLDEAPPGAPQVRRGRRDEFHRLLAETDAEAYGSPRRAELHAELFEAVRDPSLHEDLRLLATDARVWVRMLAMHGLAGAGAAARAPVEAALDDPEPAVVAAAVAALDSGGVRQLAARLIELFGRADPQWRVVRHHSALRLRTLNDPAARAAIARGITDSDGTVSHLAAEVLVENPDPAVVPWLIDVLRTGAGNVAQVAYVLGRYRVREAVPVLADAMRRAPRDAALGHACAVALGVIGTPDAGPPLVEAATSANPFVRKIALRMLRRVPGTAPADVALVAVDDPDPAVRQEAVRLLASRGDGRAVPRLIGLADSRHARVALSGLLRLRDPRAVATALQILATAPDKTTRHLAGRVVVASATGPIVAFPPRDLHARRAYAWIFGQPGSQDRSTWLIRELASAQDEILRARCAEGLGRIGATRAADHLRTALHDVSPRVRAKAATALGRLGQADAAAWLTPCLTDTHRDVRAAAAAALRRLASA